MTKFNPLGYQVGYGTSKSDSMMGYFPSAGSYAKYSNTEYILDAETVRNVGVNQLEQMRLSKGASFNEMRKHINTKSLAIGGTVAATPRIDSSGATVTTSINQKPVQMNLNINLGVSKESFIEVISSYLNEEGGAEALMDVIANITQNQGNNKLAQTLFDATKK